MNKNKYHTVIGIRTHLWSDTEERLYKQLLQAFPKEQIFVIADETKGKVNTPSYIKKISWNNQFIEEQNLLNYNHFNRGIGWLCGDYFYYAFLQQVNSDFYWLIESDVLFTFESTKTFFDKASLYNDDALLANFDICDSHDYWYASGCLIYKEPYKCLFPLNRLSAKAIKLCKDERQRLSNEYRTKGAFAFTHNPMVIHFPNDEILVSCTLIREGISVRSLNSIFPDNFSYFGFDKWYSDSIANLSSFSNQVIHPVRSSKRIAERIINELVKDIKQHYIWNYNYFSENDILNITKDINVGISLKIEEKLKEQYALRHYMPEFKSVLLEYVKNYLYPYGMSSNDQNHICLNVKYKEYILALDFTLENDTLLCKLFEHSNRIDFEKFQFSYFNDECYVEKNAFFLFKEQLANIEQGKMYVLQALAWFYKNITLL